MTNVSRNEGILCIYEYIQIICLKNKTSYFFILKLIKSTLKKLKKNNNNFNNS